MVNPSFRLPAKINFYFYLVVGYSFDGHVFDDHGLAFEQEGTIPQAVIDHFLLIKAPGKVFSLSPGNY